MDKVERVARALAGPRADEMVLAGNPIGEPCEYPRWMLHQLDARAAIAAMQADAAPVAWMYRAGPYLRKYGPDLPPVIKLAVSRWPIETQTNWTETPLYAHPPVDDRVSTTKPVDDRETGNTSDKTDTAPVVKSDTAPVSDKLRPAVEVWEDAYGSYMLNEVGQDYEAAAAVIEADREAVRAALVAEIAAWLRDSDEAFAMTDWEIADQIEAKFGGRDV